MFDALFRIKRGLSPAFQEQLSVPAWPAVVYAIGDVHGCLDQLLALERMIEADSLAIEGDKLLVLLGDYVDRGPNSAGVLDHLLRPPLPHFTRILLAGNHEEFFLNAILGLADDAWLEFGGLETLQSYGLDTELYRSLRPTGRRKLLESHIPQDHVTLLRQLAVSLQVNNMVFVHAGIRRNIPMQQQDRRDLMWIRKEFLEASPTDGLLVVHGHTPSAEPEMADGRIGIDTGAYATGKLTGVRLLPDEPPVFFTTGV